MTESGRPKAIDVAQLSEEDVLALYVQLGNSIAKTAKRLKVSKRTIQRVLRTYTHRGRPPGEGYYTLKRWLKANPTVDPMRAKASEVARESGMPYNYVKSFLWRMRRDYRFDVEKQVTKLFARRRYVVDVKGRKIPTAAIDVWRLPAMKPEDTHVTFIASLKDGRRVCFRYSLLSDRPAKDPRE